MTNIDKFPENIEFEIDRRRLTRYWRLQGLLGYCGLMPIVAIFFALAAISGGAQRGYLFDLSQILFTGILYVVIAIGAGFSIGLALYFVTCHYQSKWRAENLRLMVEGPCLRLISGSLYISDRRIHFRSVCDYSTHEGPLLKWLGMKTLGFQVLGSHRTLSNMVPGLVDPVGVRDKLCEIDAAREN